VSELKCGCRPADRFCEHAEELRAKVQAETAWLGACVQQRPTWVADAKRAVGRAERALSRHLRGAS
jgi:hypothetical protein